MHPASTHLSLDCAISGTTECAFSWPILTLKLVSMATSLEQSQKGQNVFYDQIHIVRENLVKIGQVDPEIICIKGFIFKMRGVRRRPDWTEVHQIYKQDSQILIEFFKVRMAILQSVSECQGDE